MDRRAAVAALGAAAFGSALKGSVSPGPRLSVGRLKQSVSRWPYREIPLAAFARAAAGMGVAVVKAVGSPRVKLLYDIYHMQIMEGDIIRTIRDNKDWIAHFHTGGVPGRHELDGTQELNWRAVAAAIADTGFAGFVAHEFTPTRDPLTSLRQAVETCTV